ncbi:MAG: hypothetical protein FJ091_07540 [Deltaproteobacteria bacterium]|nr:hypothetical protein [Deltaproteobacteria bacterium]
MSARQVAVVALLLALPIAALAFGPGGGGGRTTRQVAQTELWFALLTIAGSVLALRRARGKRPFVAGLLGAALGFVAWVPLALWLLGGSAVEVLGLAFFLYSPRVLVIGFASGAVATLIARRRGE